MASAYFRAIRLFSLVLLGFSLPDLAMAQSDPVAPDTVSWSVQADAPVKPNGHATVTLHGTVQDGWHVYSLRQAPEGPTPLVASLDTNSVATADGAVSESTPAKIHDPAFGLTTQFYAKQFTVTVPVRFTQHPGAGHQVIPLSVRFQTCNGRVCQPPRTVHLSAPVDLPAGG